MLRRRLAPYLWIVPTALFLCVFLIYPVIDTARISFLNEDSSAFVGLDNYTDVFGEEDTRTAACPAVHACLVIRVLQKFQRADFLL